MTTAPMTPEELSRDLVLAMRHLQPVLTAMVTLLQNTDQAAETRIDRMTKVMERIAIALERTTKQLAPLASRMEAQEKALADLSGRVQGLQQHLEGQGHGRDRLEGRIQELLDLLQA